MARRFLFQTIHDVELILDCERAGCAASLTAAVIDSQTVKAPEAAARGYDAGKRIVGRRRHIAVDTDDRLLMVNLTPADISDSASAQMILATIRRRRPWVKHMFVDGAYDRSRLMDKATDLDFVLEIIRRRDGVKGFEIQPRRWVVERMFGWRRIDVSKAMILVAKGGNLLRRNAHPSFPKPAPKATMLDWRSSPLVSKFPEICGP